VHRSKIFTAKEDLDVCLLKSATGQDCDGKNDEGGDCDGEGGDGNEEDEILIPILGHDVSFLALVISLGGPRKIGTGAGFFPAPVQHL